MITFLRQIGAKKLEKEKDRRREEQLIACISLTECCMHLLRESIYFAFREKFEFATAREWKRKREIESDEQES